MDLKLNLIDTISTEIFEWDNENEKTLGQIGVVKENMYRLPNSNTESLSEFEIYENGNLMGAFYKVFQSRDLNAGLVGAINPKNLNKFRAKYINKSIYVKDTVSKGGLIF